ncbi:TonB-dependent receptor [hydrothermal vent metagenome]|uniref:TonB-dependent receptor n=1 Tax=hydrothermal vent metagenome TaxID=652676 RepID=A0A3B0SQ11_9ZZZZ
MKREFYLATAGLAVCLANPAWADDTLTDDPILVTGSRIPIPISEVTAAASIIPAEELQARGDQYIADALRRIPGVAVNRSGPAGALTQVRLRGSEANHVLVLIDGMQASDPFTDGFNFGAASSDGVARIEVLRGEQSALWGTDAIGGVVQILNEPLSDGDTLRGQIEWGSFNTSSFAVAASHNGDIGKVWGNVSGLNTHGYDVSGNNGETDGFSQLTGTGGANLTLSDNWTFQVRGRAQSSSSEFDADTDFDGRLNDVERALDTDIAQARIALVGTGGPGNLSHQVFGSYLNSRTNSGSSRSKGTRRKIGWQATGNWTTGAVDNRLTALVEGRFETYENDGGPGAGQNQKQDNNMYAFAAEYQGNAGPVILSLSARNEQNDLFANANSLRAGVAVNVQSLNGKFRASVGQGVKNPGFFELFGFFPAFFVGNPDLKAEKSTGFELGWDQKFALGSASVTVFTSDLENEIFTDFGVFPATARNRTGTSRREGIELGLDLQWTQGLSTSSSVSFLRSQENGIDEIRRPNFLASFSLFWTDASQNWQASVGVDHNGDMQDTDFGSFQRVNLPAYTLVRAKLSRKIGKSFQVYLRAENLANNKYQEVFSFAGQERAIYGGLIANF